MLAPPVKFSYVACLVCLAVAPPLANTLMGQAFYTEDFTTSPANSYAFNGFGHSPNGAAAARPDWGQRNPIQSESRGGSMRYSGGTPGPIFGILNVPLPQDGMSTLYVDFYQYLGLSANEEVTVSVSGSNGFTYDTTLVLNLPAGGETSPGSYHILEVDAAVTASADVSIIFQATGSPRFWIVDDIGFHRQRPIPPTFPRHYGDSLITFGIPYVVDSVGAPAAPYELIFEFEPNTSPGERAATRNALGAQLVRSCVCDRIEVWRMPGGAFFDNNNGEPLGPPAVILERTLPFSGRNKVDGVDLNYYNFSELVNRPLNPNQPLTEANLAGLSPAPDNVVRVAILDTGVDLEHPDLRGFLFRDDDSIGDGVDNDDNCLPDNPLGWNYVDGNNNPSDDNGHGTHVSGVLAQNLTRCDDCIIQLVPYKTHDRFGVGTLFNSACATLQASVVDGADVINASWGFYGSGSPVLSNVITTAAGHGTLIVAAAGNDSLFVDIVPQFPALYDLPNVLAVAAHAGDMAENATRTDFSNYSSNVLPLAAPGVDVVASLPGSSTGPKSGTSQAAPAVSAKAAMYHCANGPGYAPARAYLLSSAATATQLDNTVVNQRVLNKEAFCEQPLAPATEEDLTAVCSICYDATAQLLDVKALRQLADVEVIVFDADGGGVLAYGSSSFLNIGQSLSTYLSYSPPGSYRVHVRRGNRTYESTITVP